MEDGLLVSESGPDKQYGYLATDKYYDDFELTLEFKQEANGNSGVFVRSTVDGTKVSGWQVEVAPPGHNTGGVYESYGRGWLIKPDPEKDKVLKEGEWNTMKIKLAGNKLTSWLNGTEMISITDEKIGAGKGAIALQIHDGGGSLLPVEEAHVNRKQAAAGDRPPASDCDVSVKSSHSTLIAGNWAPFWRTGSYHRPTRRTQNRIYARGRYKVSP